MIRVEGRRPKVLHVTTADSSLELLLRPQLEAFQAAGYDVVTASAPGPYVPSLEAAGIRHIPMDHATRSMDLREDVAALREMFQVFRREKPDIAHTHNPKPGWYGRVTARAAGVKGVVNTVHGLYASPTDTWQRRYLIYALERVASSFSDSELVQNPEDLAVLKKLRVPESKLGLLGNGVDLNRFTPPDPERRRRAREALGIAPHEVAVGAVGRLVWEKGIRDLIDAARQLPWLVDDVRVFIAGPLDPAKDDGLAEADLDRITAESGVEFLGERADVESVYDALDIYVLASHREGFPRSAMEAAAMGIPVVASDIRGCREVVQQGVNGILFPVQDTVALADAIVRLAKDPALRASMGDAAIRKAIRSFDQQQVIDRTLDVYEWLLAR